MWLSWLALGAQAQVSGALPTTPQLPVDPFRPVVDGGAQLATESPRIHPGSLAASHLSWAHAPLRWQPLDGEIQAVIKDAVALHLGARFGAGPLQIGVSAPAYLVTGLAWQGPDTILGDPLLQLKLSMWRETHGVGLIGRLSLPLGADRRALGQPAVSGEIGGLVGGLVGPLATTANLGIRLAPPSELGEIPIGDQLWLRGSASLELTPRWQPALELIAETALSDPDPSKSPVELLTVLHHRWSGGPILHLGLGRGLSTGVGAPSWRLIAGMTWRQAT
ncbi:MAG TPA: hypothetical protein ENK18_24735 [Deltaproteobacteria bacterium]|nr:hypothetical protein [Deltaproteobacteria bacterium]